MKNKIKKLHADLKRLKRCKYSHSEWSIDAARAALDQRAELLRAAKIVYADLNRRIELADSACVPVFDGIADLHDAINRAEAP